MRICLSLLLAIVALSLGACTTGRHLPPYEPPLARTDFQQVRTTAYTDSESDHRQYGNRTALGGVLHPAPIPIVPRAIPVTDGNRPRSGDNYQSVAYVTRLQPFRQTNFALPTIYGSAAADWSRWPAGTIFRVVTTGQL